MVSPQSGRHSFKTGGNALSPPTVKETGLHQSLGISGGERSRSSFPVPGGSRLDAVAVKQGDS